MGSDGECTAFIDLPVIIWQSGCGIAPFPMFQVTPTSAIGCQLPSQSGLTMGSPHLDASGMKEGMISNLSRARTQRNFGTCSPGKQKLTLFLSSHEKASYPAPGYHHLPRCLPRIIAENPPSCWKMERLKDFKK